MKVTIYICSLLICLISGESLVLKENAADYVMAGFKRTTRRGKTTVDLTKMELEWQPFEMIENRDQFDRNDIKVGLKVENGEWQILSDKPTKRGGGKYRLVISNILPCKYHSIQFIFKSKEGEETIYEHPSVVEAASQEEIATSRDFIPEIPNALTVNSVSETVDISWDPVECATSYEITYKKILDDEAPFVTVTSETNSVTLSDQIDTCSEYEVNVAAITGEAYGDAESVEFFTQPASDAVQKLSPTINPDMTSVEISWEGWEKLSCVEEYEVKVCDEEGTCFDSNVVKRDDSLPNMVYIPTFDLNKCSSYDFFLKPLFDGGDLQETSFPFKTLAPQVEGISDLLKPVTAIAGEEQMTKISWTSVECADSYEIFQHVSGDAGDWETIGTSDSNELSIKGVPCTEYRYGVKVTIGDQTSDIVEAEESVITHLPSHAPYSPPNLIISPDVNGAEISWDHALCITSYRLAICDSNKENCFDNEIVIDNYDQHNVTWMIEDLKACSDYSVEVFATSNEQELGAEPHAFSTTAPEAKPPANVKYDMNVNGKMDIQFDHVECASLYHVHRKINDEEFESIHETSKEQASISLPEACNTYSVGVSSVVDDVESEMDIFHDAHVPPVKDDNIALTIDGRVNDTISLLVQLPTSNSKCKVEQYHIKYGKVENRKETEVFLPEEEVENGMISLEVAPGSEKDGIFIEGRIKYADFESWSPWASTAEKVAADPLSGGGPGSTLIPIVVGVLVALIIVSILIFFIVKKRNSENKFKSENGEDAEEKKNLKDHSAV